MGTIADKLDYLTGTKELFKDRLNSLGAEITSSTTFRNYLTWLDTFYEEVSDKTDLSVNGIVGRTSQNTAILPSEYTQVDYIASSGTQYIDTGVNADNNMDLKIDMQYIEQSPVNNNTNLGTIYKEDNGYRRWHFTKLGANLCLYALTSGTNIPLNTYDTNRHTYYVKTTENKVIYDGIEQDLPDYTTSDTTLNFWLFGRNSNVNNLIYYNSSKLYSCQMYYNNVLVRDFIPCYRNSDNEVGLYDLVNNVFYTNQGTGAFTYSSVVGIPNPDYPQPINNLTGNVAYKITTQNGEQTFTIPLGDIELGKITTYEDKIYSSNGRFYLKKNIAKLTFNGSETWNKSNITGSVLTQRFRTTQSITMISNLAICDKFINRASGMSAGDYECFLVTNNTSTYISININRLTENTVQAFETWLSNNNVTTYVVLATPTTTEITQENYPALYNALKQIQDYLTSYKINKEFILGYSSPEIEY